MAKKRISVNKVYNINVWHLIALIPIIIFNYYKNGVLVVRTNYMTSFSSLQYLVIPVIIVVLSYIFEIYYYIGKAKKNDLTDVVNSFVPFANVLCYLVCGPNMPLYIIIPLIVAIDILMKVIGNKVCLNRVALFKCILFILLALLGIYNNSNLYELKENVVFSSVSDSFLGFNIGEMGAISNLAVLIGFVILLFNKYYKKGIAFTAIITYLLFCCFFIAMKMLTPEEILSNTFNSGILFAIVYVLTLSDASPVLHGGKIIYSIFFSILAAIFVNIYSFDLGIYFIILALSFISPLINKLKISVYK